MKLGDIFNRLNPNCSFQQKLEMKDKKIEMKDKDQLKKVISSVMKDPDLSRIKVSEVDLKNPSILDELNCLKEIQDQEISGVYSKDHDQGYMNNNLKNSNNHHSQYKRKKSNKRKQHDECYIIRDSFNV